MGEGPSPLLPPCWGMILAWTQSDLAMIRPVQSTAFYFCWSLLFLFLSFFLSVPLLSLHQYTLILPFCQKWAKSTFCIRIGFWCKVLTLLISDKMAISVTAWWSLIKRHWPPWYICLQIFHVHRIFAWFALKFCLKECFRMQHLKSKISQFSGWGPPDPPPTYTHSIISNRTQDPPPSVGVWWSTHDYPKVLIEGMPQNAAFGE